MNASKEILKDTALALSSGRLWLLLLVAGAAFFFGLERLMTRRRERVRTILFWSLFTVAMGLGLWAAWDTAFVCDDAFISFRYARNFALGKGLVWNEGEWVEGYTNFLWTFLLGLVGKLGGNIPETALWGCLATFVITLFGTAIAVRKAAPSPPALPFAVIALAALVPFHTFATSGLETMPAAMLVVLALVASGHKRGAWISGILLVFATMMRPDHVLFYACFGLTIALEDVVFVQKPLLRRLDFKRYAAYLLPFFVIFVPFYLIRWKVYGDFFPNTYYAKSGDGAYWSQGGIYGLHFVASSTAWIWLPTFLVVLFGKSRNRTEFRTRAFALLAVPLFATYVIKVGGDFMEYRFFVPLLPIVAISMEVSLRWKFSKPKHAWTPWLAGFFGILSLGTALFPVRLVPPRGIRWGIAREPSFYKVRQAHPLIIECGWEHLGRELNISLSSKGVKPPLAAGAIGLLGYYSDLPLVDGMGLTNRAIAHKTIKGRGRVGHEKVANVPELIEQGAVVDVGFRFDAYFRESALIKIGPSKLFFLRYDPTWAARIAKLPGTTLPSPERDVETLVRTAPRERVLAGRKFYRDFLAIHPKRDYLLWQIETRLASIADFEEDLPKGYTTGKGLRIERAERPSGVTGDAWLASLPDPKGGRVGKVEIPIGPLYAEEIRFVLGGKKSDKLTVKLIISGEEVDSVRPTGLPGATPVSFSVRDYLGESGSIIIEDADPAPNVGILVDAVHTAPTDGDLRERLRNAGPTFGSGYGELLREAFLLLPPDDPDRKRLESKIAVRLNLDKLPENAVIKGEAFGKGPVGKAIAGQDPIVGFEGSAFLNSMHGGDQTKGRVEFGTLVLPVDPIAVLVSGGTGCHKTFVGLEVDGKIVARACGKNDHFMRREELRAGTYAGKRGRIVAVDDSDGPWGHIVVDDILIPR
ncbi:MAG: hypothetical protein IPK82_33635 [Polyangiaceae bacterium]|nr:hypothetical protein [Polyangiaceae bacterium]